MGSTKPGGKLDFKQNFKNKYKEWAGDENKEDGSLGAVKAEEVEEEEDREKTDSTALDPKTIFGFDNEIKSMENFLLDQKVYKEFKSLVILGEYGVGKTTLCKMIFNKDEVKSVYSPRIWVSMPSTESKKGLNGKICVVKKILRGLGVEDKMLEEIKEEAKDEFKRKEEEGDKDRQSFEEEEIAALLYALHLNLRWKKYLIVIDDVRETDNWDEKLDEKLEENEIWGKHISDGFPKGSGGRVIYTTREETLAKKLVAEGHEIHRLWPLSDYQSVWKIYESAVLKKKREPPRNDKKCIDELMNKSRGLPLAAILIAELEPVFLDDETPDSANPADPDVPANSADPAVPANSADPAVPAFPATSADRANSANL